MPKNVIVSFEEDIIRVVYAGGTSRSPVITNAFTLDDSEFEDFLKKEKTREFIVVNSFSDYFFDTVVIPPAKGKLVRVLLENEIRKPRSLFKEGKAPVKFIFPSTEAGFVRACQTFFESILDNEVVDRERLRQLVEEVLDDLTNRDVE